MIESSIMVLLLYIVLNEFTLYYSTEREADLDPGQLHSHVWSLCCHSWEAELTWDYLYMMSLHSLRIVKLQYGSGLPRKLFHERWVEAKVL